ncbi:Co2+/Mg2+ efflux protein ApaG [Asticcacaulis sp. EMRT-3]|uniref:Co2+/Mg2+ efflux protein ApaG n=1 Tax=Asticcacaulis sp. EMRT-3 TaxID=3040349 RepID=UPI0024AF59E3|nr:Co2+/Mg2+ efflux protein ApaG [Asticcacaulis sp. EMRT-3]MDI7775442.1 Co2+/Mg2+ efflux protein ApaG [Asticcacaulis sp. EMRT-3]
MPYQTISHDIQIAVEVEYVPPEQHGHTDRYVWAYHITMENLGSDTAQLKTRHWTITDGRGHVEHVDGPGVVGETPVLQPGESFTYTSGCPLTTDSGMMCGHYVFEDAKGAQRMVEIPAFSLDLPDARHRLH